MENNGDFLDPYGKLEFVIGSGNDFVCFDYRLEGASLAIKSVLNSETSSFIMDFQPVEKMCVLVAEPIPYVKSLIDLALTWCGENDVKHDKRG